MVVVVEESESDLRRGRSSRTVAVVVVPFGLGGFEFRSLSSDSNP